MSMIKKLILGFVLACVASPTFAAATFFWRGEATTLTSDDKSVGDTTATANGGISISGTAAKYGSNGLLTTDANDFYTFDSASIASSAQGSAGLWVNFRTTWPSAGLNVAFTIRDTADATDAIQIQGSSTDELRLDIRLNGSAIQLASTACNMVADTWYFIVIRWHIANDDREISCYNSSLTLIQTTSDLTTDLAAFEPTTISEFRVGNNSSHTGVAWYDNVFISNSYSEDLISFAAITSFLPTFTTAPATGTITNTTIPTTFTPDQTGTAYGVACADGGGTVTVANVLAGQCSGGGASAASWSEAVVKATGDGHTFTGLSAGTVYDLYFAQTSGLGGNSAAVDSILNATTTGGSAPSFTVSPTVSSTTATTYVLSYTPSASATFYAVACNPGESTPTAAQVKTADCGSGANAESSANEAVTGADTTTLSSIVFPRHDIYAVLNNGSGDSAVASLTDQNRSADSGQSIVCTTSLSGTSPFADNAYFNPDAAAGDCVEHASTTTPGSYAVTLGVDGDISIAAGGDPSRQTIAYCIQDVSGVAGQFTTPACWSADDTLYVNNAVPVCTNPEEPLVLTQNVAMSAISLTNYCTDADTDTLTFTETGATSLPTGVSLTGGNTLSGTPTVENEAGVVLTFTATDVAGDTDTFDITVYVVNTWTLPNCVNSDIGECATLIAAAAPWQASNIQLAVGSFVCSGITSGDIVSQTPSASTQMAAFASTLVDVAMSCGSGFVYGRAVSDTGVLQTLALLDAEAVPGTASLKNGIAADSAGYTYVCPWPSTLAVGYLGGVAIRQDGCLIVAEEATISTKYYTNGVPVSYRGEVSVSLSAPTSIKGGVGRVGDAICVSDF